MKKKMTVSLALAATIVLGQSFLMPDSQLAYGDDVAEGKSLAYDRKLGNCLSCHAMGDGELPGTQGPPLVAMKARFPDRDVLFKQVYNSLERNPDSMMPPFGLHNVLSEEQIDKIVTYLYTL